jgi:hypothetical protein
MIGTWMALVVSVGLVALLLRAVKAKPEAVETCAACGIMKPIRQMSRLLIDQAGTVRWACRDHDHLDPWTL